jgi:hypothetical protein
MSLAKKVWKMIRKNIRLLHDQIDFTLKWNWFRIKCLEPMRSILPSGCVLRAKAYAQLYQYYIKNNG